MMNHPSSAAHSSQSGDQLMKRVAATYACCDSYMDEGEVTTAHIVGDDTMTSLRPFSTAFVRPRDFRFEFLDRFREDLEWNRCIVWQGGSDESVLTWWSIQPGVENNPSLSRALAGATGVSGGSAVTIPNLLMPDTIKCNGIMAITDWEIVGEETVGNATATKVHGVGPPYKRGDGQMHERAITLWVETQTLLILQTFHTSQISEDFRAETTTTYRPQMDIPVPGDKLQFGAVD